MTTETTEAKPLIVIAAGADVYDTKTGKWGKLNVAAARRNYTRSATGTYTFAANGRTFNVDYKFVTVQEKE